MITAITVKPLPWPVSALFTRDDYVTHLGAVSWGAMPGLS